MENIIIFDTSLRDGEQSPGFSMNVEEKVRMAKQLQKLQVDIIEAGFPIASEGDFEAVRAISREIKNVKVAALARTDERDIVRAAEAIEPADVPRIHTFIATSNIHLEKKLRLTKEQALEKAVKGVRLARKYVDDVEFSAEDATRSDWEFLCDIFSAVISEGATTINIPDTVGYITPAEFSKLIEYLHKNIKGIEKAVISVHCHNDLGLAVANSLSAVQAGVRQIECTVNGIGERAGNASLEEIVMGIWTRRDIYPFKTNIVTQQIYPASRLLTHITGLPVQVNKAIVGANAFAHEAGLHQDGVLKDRRTYEIITPDTIGISSNVLILGKHSGRHAFRERLKSLGYELSNDNLDKAFNAFKALADKKKEVYEEDLEAIIMEEVLRIPHRFKLRSVNVSSGTEMIPTATVEMEIDGKISKASGTGDGPVDAVYKVITAITQINSQFLKFTINAITGGTEAMGEVTVCLKENELTVLGHGAHIDI
ncbi:MAG: 2-isopropylmalate synthase, partial [Planctomycetota bacterium]